MFLLQEINVEKSEQYHVDNVIKKHENVLKQSLSNNRHSKGFK